MRSERFELRRKAHACRIYGIAKPLGWKTTYSAIAAALGLSWATVRDTIVAMGWQDRFPTRSQRHRTPTPRGSE